MLDSAFALGDAGFSVAAADLAGIAIPPGGPVEDGELAHATGRAGAVGLQRASLAVGTTISIQVGVFVFAIAPFTFRGQDAPGRAAVLVGARFVGKLYVAVGHRGVVFRNITAGVRFGLNLFNVTQIGVAAVGQQLPRALAQLVLDLMMHGNKLLKIRRIVGRPGGHYHLVLAVYGRLQVITGRFATAWRPHGARIRVTERQSLFPTFLQARFGGLQGFDVIA